jgi:hypothetical protein
MDKTIFFDSLSFLTKFETEVWPPKVKAFSSNVVLSDNCLSVEVDKGPIFLKNADKDPAMFACDMVLLEPLLGSPSSASTSLSHGTPKSANRHRSSQEELEEQQGKTQLIVRLDQTQAYRIDASRILETTLQKGNHRPLPTSMLVKFQDCQFRFFSMSSTKNDRLQSACNALLKIPRVFVSPQTDPGTIIMSQEEAVKSTKRKLRALERGRKETVECFLYHDQLPSSPNKVCRHLDTVASSLSYASDIELEYAILAQHQGLESIQQELEDLLTAYFPRAKQRRSDSEADRQPNTEECIDMAHDVLQRKQSILEERHKLAFLPTRG